jgi:starch synthase
LNILILAAEVAPFAKVGGLADVAGALPKALRAQGHDVRVAMPCYKMIETNPKYAVRDALSEFPVPIRPGVTEAAFVKQTSIRAEHMQSSGDAEIPVYLIGSPPAESADSSELGAGVTRSGYFQQATQSQKVYVMEADPYIFFCRAALEMLSRLEPAWTPDVLHCNDWHTGLIPIYAQEFYRENPAVRHAATVFTIHNLAYQGNFPADQWYKTGLPQELFSVDGLEFYGQWTFLKGGVQFADRVNTVSKNYACEIQTSEYGCGLDGLMRSKADEGKLSGIVNGIDYEEHNPATDPRLPHAFSLDAPNGKIQCKTALQSELGLPKSKDVALIGLISRLADQKGFDLIHAVAEQMLELPVQFVLLGTGDPTYARYFKELQTRYPKQVQATIAFDTDLAQRIYAGSDLFLMPSRFEPCGLGQMFALRYGAIPIVRATGGLADTVHDFDLKQRPDGNGFVFTEYSPNALLATIQRAVGSWQQPAQRNRLLLRALASDFSWQRPAQAYQTLYTQAGA